MLTLSLAKTDSEAAVELRLEHSLVSLSKWESTFEKPFFGKEEKTEEETKAYVRMMLLDSPPENFESLLRPEHISVIQEYINSRQSATWFREEEGRGKSSNETITSELIYYWLIQFQIPFTCETWHFNRLMTLIKICGVKQAKPKKMSKHAQAQQMRELNAQRRQELGTSG